MSAPAHLIAVHGSHVGLQYGHAMPRGVASSEPRTLNQATDCPMQSGGNGQQRSTQAPHAVGGLGA